MRSLPRSAGVGRHTATHPRAWRPLPLPRGEAVKKLGLGSSGNKRAQERPLQQGRRLYEPPERALRACYRMRIQNASQFFTAPRGRSETTGFLGCYHKFSPASLHGRGRCRRDGGRVGRRRPAPTGAGFCGPMGRRKPAQGGTVLSSFPGQWRQEVRALKELRSSQAEPPN